MTADCGQRPKERGPRRMERSSGRMDFTHGRIDPPCAFLSRRKTHNGQEAYHPRGAVQSNSVPSTVLSTVASRVQSTVEKRVDKRNPVDRPSSTEDGECSAKDGRPVGFDREPV